MPPLTHTSPRVNATAFVLRRDDQTYYTGHRGNEWSSELALARTYRDESCAKKALGRIMSAFYDRHGWAPELVGPVKVRLATVEARG